VRGLDLASALHTQNSLQFSAYKKKNSKFVVNTFQKNCFQNWRKLTDPVFSEVGSGLSEPDSLTLLVPGIEIRLLIEKGPIY
jgi:hypothetical protein